MFPVDDNEYDFSRWPRVVSASRFSGVGMFSVVAVEADNGLASGTSAWHCAVGGEEAIGTSRVWKPSCKLLIIIAAS